MIGEPTEEVLADIAYILQQGYQKIMSTYVSEADEYASYKKGNCLMISSESQIEMEVLSFLENLGFCMQKKEVYLLKALLVRVAESLEGIRSNEDYDALCTDLSYPYSQFYFDVAHNELNIGIKSFHTAISKAFADANPDAADSKLFARVKVKVGNEDGLVEIILAMASFLNEEVIPNITGDQTRQRITRNYKIML